MLSPFYKLVESTVGTHRRFAVRSPAIAYNSVDEFAVGRQQRLPVPHSGSRMARGHNPSMSIDDMSSQQVPSSDVAESQSSSRIPGVVWPKTNSILHRFISQDDPTLQKQTGGVTYKTRQKFLGTRRDGVYDGSFRLQFTLPGKDNSPKGIELLPLSKGEPTFAAVKVKLPLGAVITSLSPDFITRVEEVRDGSNAEESGIMEGDIIRAVSVPDVQEEKTWSFQLWDQMAKSWRKSFGVPVPIGTIPVPDSEESMVILGEAYFADVYAALQENKRVNGDNAEVVLLVERPELVTTR